MTPSELRRRFDEGKLLGHVCPTWQRTVGVSTWGLHGPTTTVVCAGGIPPFESTFYFRFLCSPSDVRFCADFGLCKQGSAGLRSGPVWVVVLQGAPELEDNSYFLPFERNLEEATLDDNAALSIGTMLLWRGARFLAVETSGGT